MTDNPTMQLSDAGHAGGGELHLPRPPGVIRRFWARHRFAADTALACFVGLVAASEAVRTVGRDAESAWLTALAVALVAISVTGIHVRRTRPLATVLLGCVSILLLVWTRSDTVLAPVVVAVYSVAVYRSVSSGAAAAVAAWAAAVLAATAGVVFRNPVLARPVFDADQHANLTATESVLAFATQFGILLALALAIGANVGNRRRYLAALIDRARQLATERDRQGQLATALERSRIAREMHDIVSHSLTVMVALAEGSAVAAGQAAPDAATAMRSVADTGRGAMIDMRRMLGVLGGDGAAETAPQPGLADLPALIDRFRSLGIPAVFRLEGPEAHDPAVQLAVYRLVQESLTNALRYSRGPTEVAITITIRDGILTASVTDNGLTGFAAARADTIGTGRGLLGLRERVAAIGGALTAGPRTDGPGWAVTAKIPLTQVFGDEADGSNP